MASRTMCAKNIVVQKDSAFNLHLKEISQKSETSVIFDGAGWARLNNINDVIPNNSAIYSYGYLESKTHLTIHTGI